MGKQKVYKESTVSYCANRVSAIILIIMMCFLIYISRFLYNFVLRNPDDYASLGDIVAIVLAIAIPVFVMQWQSPINRIYGISYATLCKVEMLFAAIMVLLSYILPVLFVTKQPIHELTLQAVEIVLVQFLLSLTILLLVNFTSIKNHFFLLILFFNRYLFYFHIFTQTSKSNLSKKVSRIGEEISKVVFGRHYRNLLSAITLQAVSRARCGDERAIKTFAAECNALICLCDQRHEKIEDDNVSAMMPYKKMYLLFVEIFQEVLHQTDAAARYETAVLLYRFCPVVHARNETTSIKNIFTNTYYYKDIPHLALFQAYVQVGFTSDILQEQTDNFFSLYENYYIKAKLFGVIYAYQCLSPNIAILKTNLYVLWSMFAHTSENISRLEQTLTKLDNKMENEFFPLLEKSEYTTWLYWQITAMCDLFNDDMFIVPSPAILREKLQCFNREQFVL